MPSERRPEREAWTGPLRAGRSRDVPDGPLCAICGHGGGYHVHWGETWAHVSCLGYYQRTPKPEPAPEPQLFDPDA